MYVYHQHEKPNNAMGVEVVVSVLDPNNNLYEVGRTRSDATGTYKLTFDPPVPGEYTVISTFPGSKSYWPSVAETAIVVEDASPTPTQQPVVSLPPTEMYVLGIGVAIIIAIAIVGALILMAVRKTAVKLYTKIIFPFFDKLTAGFAVFKYDCFALENNCNTVAFLSLV